MRKNWFLLLAFSLLTTCVQACSDSDSKEDVTPIEKPEDPGDDKPEKPGDKEAAEYFVSVSAPSGGDGSIERPFNTIEAGLAAAGPGDVVTVRGGVYSEAVYFHKSGTASKPIVVRAYEGETPIIDGREMSWGGSLALVRISEVSYITFEGFEIRNLITDDGTKEPNGIVVSQGATNITVRNNHIHHIQNTAATGNNAWPGAHAIHVIGNTNRAMRNIVVDGNHVHDMVTGTSETVTVNGYVDNFTISNNVIHDVSNIAIDAAGGYAANSNPQFNYARNGVICGNTIYNAENSLGQLDGGYGAIAIYADGARNITVERNRVFHCDRGIGMVSETDNYPTTGCIVRNNIVYDCHRTGIYMGGYLGYTGGGTEECYIINNTLYGNNTRSGHFSQNEVEGEIRLTENCRRNVVKNNLICSRRAEDLFIHKYTNTGSDNVIDNNHYSGLGAWVWGTRSWGAEDWTWTDRILTLAAWSSACGGDAKAHYSATPVYTFTPAVDSAFAVGNDSTIKNAGEALIPFYVGTTDFAGNPRTVDGKISIGALQ